MAADKITDEMLAAIHTCLRMLSGVCDGARELDGCGFNKIDAAIGRTLAMQGELTKRQAVLGQRFCTKYRRQLPEALVAAAGGVAAS